MTFIYFILMLSLIVCIHEFGHFLFAKKAGIYVYEFSIGMGPKLCSFHRKNDETLYCIRLFPIGGYVQMAGEEVEDDPDIPASKKMQSKTWWQRFCVVIAGVLFNFILAIILLFVVALISGAPTNRAYVGTVEKDTPAFEAGIQTGDEIIGFNGKKINSVDMLLLHLQIHMGEELTFEVKNSKGDIQNISIQPKEIKENDQTRYQYGFGFEQKTESGLWASIKYAFTKTFGLMEQMIFVIFYLITGKLGLNSLAGPVGIFNIVGQSAEAGFLNLVYLTAFISINVGFVNLLPIPAFDGGRLLFLIIEKIKGSPVDSKIENTIHSIGFILLMLLVIAITYNDIMRLFH